MSKLSGIVAATAAATAITLLIAAIVLPSGLDESVPVFQAACAPLAWAAIVACISAADGRGLATAFISALPFSAYAAAAFGGRPAVPTVAALAASALAAVAVRASMRGNNVPRIRVAAALALGAGPAIATTLGSGAGAGFAVAALTVTLASYAMARRRR